MREITEKSMAEGSEEYLFSPRMPGELDPEKKNPLTWKLGEEDPSKLIVSEFNVRNLDVKGSPEEWREFVSTVKSRGVIVPPVTSPSKKVLLGQRRVLAAKQIGLTTIPVLVCTREPEPLEAKTLSLLENHARKGLDIVEYSNAIKDAVKLCNLDKKKVEELTGLTRQSINAGLAYVDFTETHPEGKGLSMEKARAVNALFDSPGYRKISSEEKAKMVQLAKETPLPVLEKMAHEAIQGRRPDPRKIQYLTIYLETKVWKAIESIARRDRITASEWVTNHIMTCLDVPESISKARSQLPEIISASPP